MMKEPSKEENNRSRKFSVSNLMLKTDIKIHSNEVNSLCLLADRRLASCSDDKTIKIFNLINYQCELTLIGHQKSVLYISELNTGALISCSSDSTIKIWEINKTQYKYIQTLKEHTGIVNKVIQISLSRIGSCSDDKTVKIWDQNYRCISTLPHNGEVFSFIELKSKKFIVSCSVGAKMTFWNSENFTREKIIEHIQCSFNNSLKEISNYRILVGGMGKIYIVNTLTIQLETKVQLDNNNLVRGFFELSDNTFLYSINCSMIQLTDKEYETLNIKKNMDDFEILDFLVLEDNKLISCSASNSIKIFDF